MSSINNNQECKFKSVSFSELKAGGAKLLVDEYQSFEVFSLEGKQSDAIDILEKLIESRKLSCRVYTANRLAVAGGALFGGVTGIFSLASVVAIAAHNLATLNPDYEIIKYMVDDKLTVKAANEKREQEEREVIVKSINSLADRLNEEV
jgi:hypothetical protein